MTTLSVGPLVLDAAAETDIGMVRHANEDSMLVAAPAFVVADGMGGYEAGDRASAAVIDAFAVHVAGPGAAAIDDIRDALLAADLGVARVAETTQRGAGSTVAGAIVVADGGELQWLIFNVGDSRVYRHLGSELVQLTIDHSLGQELVDAGELKPEELATFRHRNVITRAIGAHDSTADSWLMPITNGERILICSDGLTSEVSDESIRATLTLSGRPESAARALVRRAKLAGGRDNVTVVVVDVVSGGADPVLDDAADESLGAVDPDGGPDTATIPVEGEP